MEMITAVLCVIFVFVESACATPRAVADRELYDLSKQLHLLDANGVSGVVLNLQATTTSGNQGDLATSPLFVSVPSAVWGRSTVAALTALYDNYVDDAAANEDDTAAERAEQDAFLAAVFATNVTVKAHEFLASSGYISDDINALKEYYRTIWFGLYSRAAGYVGSSGFEHMFIGELKNGISGLHSWYRYCQEEASGRMNYLGYYRKFNLGSSTLVELPLKWNGVYKPISSMAVGSSPELELALATVCFMTRPNAKCPVQGSNGYTYAYQTYTMTYNGQTYVGSAYPTV